MDPTNHGVGQDGQSPGVGELSQRELWTLRDGSQSKAYGRVLDGTNSRGRSRAVLSGILPPYIACVE